MDEAEEGPWGQLVSITDVDTPPVPLVEDKFSIGRAKGIEQNFAMQWKWQSDSDWIFVRPDTDSDSMKFVHLLIGQKCTDTFCVPKHMLQYSY